MVLWMAMAGAQVPDAALWYSGHGGTTLDNGSFVSHVQNTLLGTVATHDDLGDVDLSDYRLVIVARPTQPFDAAEIEVFSDWLAGSGGLLVVAGDQDASADPSAMNGLLEGLGSSLRVDTVTQTTLGGTCDAVEVVETSPFFALNNGISTVGHGSVLSGLGEALLVRQQADPPGNWTLAAREGAVLVTGDYDYFTGDPCGQIAKVSFWNGIYRWGCDADEDGFQDPSCGGNDCDDSDAGVGGSNDYTDADGDGFGDSLDPCGIGTVPDGGDCDDGDPQVFPGAEEVCDGVDIDCDGTSDVDATDGTPWFLDQDEDGFGDATDTVVDCAEVEGRSDIAGDCNDTTDEVSPLAPELCNGRDDDCDTQTDEGCDTDLDTGTGPPKKRCASAPGGAVGGLALLGLCGALRRSRRGRR